jgi:hypothetical protein
VDEWEVDTAMLVLTSILIGWETRPFGLLLLLFGAALPLMAMVFGPMPAAQRRNPLGI